MSSSHRKVREAKQKIVPLLEPVMKDVVGLRIAKVDGQEVILVLLAKSQSASLPNSIDDVPVVYEITRR